MLGKQRIVSLPARQADGAFPQEQDARFAIVV
jgi:hypothetical protein